MRMKKIVVALMVFVMIATGLLGNSYHIEADTNNTVKLVKATEIVAVPGETTHVTMEIKATKYTIMDPEAEVSADEKAPFTFTTPTISLNNASVQYIYTGSSVTLEFDVITKETAKMGTYPITIKFSYYDYTKEMENSCTLTSSIKIKEEKVPAQLTVGDVSLGKTSLGSKTDLSFTVRNEGEILAKNVYLEMDLKDIADANYTAKKIKIGDLSKGASKSVSLPITLLTTAGIGRKTITANFTYKTVDGEEFNSSYNINLTLTASENEAQVPKLSVKDITYKEGLKPGSSFTLTVNLENVGGAEAKNINLAVDETSIDAAGVLKDYYENIDLIDLKAGEENSVEIPLKVSKYANGGMKGIKIVITYTDKIGNSYTLTDTVYVDIIANVTPTPTPIPTPTVAAPNIVISNVNQSPSKPAAGEKVEISFDVENKGLADATGLKIATEGLSSSTFIPIEAEPYFYYDKLKAGDKVRVTVPLIVSNTITEGLNNITVKCTYTGGESSAVIPVRDVRNDYSVSKPKLIVSKYYTDLEELRAGKVFNFTFELYNTNANVSAKNITVTVSQADSIFTPTQGSNSFFINKIAPGETVSNTLEMKVKSDATTKAYPIEIVIEYEYDGAEPNPTTGEIGLKKTEKLNLQAVENSRPVVDNISVYSYDGPVTVGVPTTLFFEFYNMGKSTLNNVIARLEGDFQKSEGEMQFLGNIEAGGSTFVEMNVTPLVEGTANGVINITFEDSNGDEVLYTKDFTWDVMSAEVIDNPSGLFPDGGMGEVFNPEVLTPKKEIVPLWAFILIEVAIFIVFIPISNKIIISIYKAKLRKKEQDQY